MTDIDSHDMFDRGWREGKATCRSPEKQSGRSRQNSHWMHCQYLLLSASKKISKNTAKTLHSTKWNMAWLHFHTWSCGRYIEMQENSRSRRFFACSARKRKRTWNMFQQPFRRRTITWCRVKSVSRAFCGIILIYFDALLPDYVLAFLCWSMFARPKKKRRDLLPPSNRCRQVRRCRAQLWGLDFWRSVRYFATSLTLLDSSTHFCRQTKRSWRNSLKQPSKRSGSLGPKQTMRPGNRSR